MRPTASPAPANRWTCCFAWTCRWTPKNELDPSRALISLTDLTERTRRIFDQARVEQAAEERRDLGHELHDRLGQQLTGLNMLSATLQRRLAARDLPEADDVAELGGLIKEANLEVRRLISGLTPESITAADLTTALNGLRQNVERTHGLTVTLQSEPPPAELSDEQAEPPADDRRRSGSQRRQARPSRPDRSFAGPRSTRSWCWRSPMTAAAWTPNPRPERSRRPRIRAGFPGTTPLPSPGEIPMGGRGMHIMRYRARQIGATIHFQSPPGAGTTVRCVLTLRAPSRPTAGHVPPALIARPEV